MTENSEKRVRSKYFSSLKSISDHPFVTPESRNNRDVLEEYTDKFKESFGSDVDIVAITVGSSGVGFATTESDVDGIIFIASNKPNDATDWGQLGSTYVYNHPVGDITILDLDATLKQALREIEEPRPKYRTDLDELAFLFAPGIHEDGDMNSVHNRMRKKVLEKISQHPQKDALWSRVQESIMKYLVRYELLEWGRTEKDRTKRMYRYQRVIIDGIKGRLRTSDLDENEFSKDQQIFRIYRAQFFIESLRDSYTFPSLEIVCTEFGITV